ncbi:hypothetical protein [Halomonas daqiaonensis]|uniref:Uncharacterized protein n=1 Tax=Halomonas daqiaonensis TaxID=650850 RepID=A0A1H7WID9_9GAMM|nr:hypothetical protein [Halomonas daqiaonensis]SEM21263.1 hypothetical protein SAMN04488129_1342 [Halomonas daqiaonensis]
MTSTKMWIPTQWQSEEAAAARMVALVQAWALPVVVPVGVPMVAMMHFSVEVAVPVAQAQVLTLPGLEQVAWVDPLAVVVTLGP